MPLLAAALRFTSTHPSGQWLPKSATWRREESENAKDSRAMLERDPTLVFFGPVRCTHSTRILHVQHCNQLMELHAAKITTLARFSKLEIALRWARDVRQVCSGSVPEVPCYDSAVFFKGVLLGLQRHIFIVFHPRFRTCSRFCLKTLLCSVEMFLKQRCVALIVRNMVTKLYFDSQDEALGGALLVANRFKPNV